MNWYIGQDVVCIKTHSQGVIKEGDVFTIKGLEQSCCRINLYIGIKAKNLYYECTCGTKRLCNPNIFWFGESLFVPLESITDISEIQELLKQSVYQ